MENDGVTIDEAEEKRMTAVGWLQGITKDTNPQAT